MKLRYKDHPRSQQNVVFIHRWSFYAGSMAWEVYTRGLVICGLYKQLVFMYRWRLAGLTVYAIKLNRIRNSHGNMFSCLQVSCRTPWEQNSQWITHNASILSIPETLRLIWRTESGSGCSANHSMPKIQLSTLPWRPAAPPLPLVADGRPMVAFIPRSCFQ